MNGSLISRVSLSWVHRFHSLSGIHGPLISRPLILAWCSGFISGIPRSIILLLLLLLHSLVLMHLVKFQEVMPSLVFLRVQVILVFTLVFNIRNSPSSVPSPAIFNHTSLSSHTYIVSVIGIISFISSKTLHNILLIISAGYFHAKFPQHCVNVFILIFQSILFNLSIFSACMFSIVTSSLLLSGYVFFLHAVCVSFCILTSFSSLCFFLFLPAVVVSG